MDRLVVSLSPIILLALLIFTTWYLSPSRLGHFSFWISATSLTISALVAPVLSYLSAIPHEGMAFWSVNSLTFAVFSSLLLALYLISCRILNASTAVREHISYFRLRRLRRSAFFSMLLAAFVALSIPSSALATSGGIFIGAWGVSFGVLTTRDILHEERLYLSHLIEGYLGKDLSDEQLSFLYDSLSALGEKLSPTGQGYDKNVSARLGNKRVRTLISNESMPSPEIGLDRLPPSGWIQGAIAHRDILKKETFHLYSAAKELAASPAAKSIERQPEWNFPKYREMLDEHLRINNERSNLHGVVASPQAKLLQFQLKNLIKDLKPLILIGEKGVGKSFFATYALRLRGCASVVVLSTDQSESKRPLLNNIRELLESGDTGEIGVIIEDMHNLGLDTQSDIWELASNHPRSNQLAVTGRSGQEIEVEIPPNMLSSSLYVPPIRDREQDLFFLALDFINKASEELRLPIYKISVTAVDQLYSNNWRGNCDELAESCFQAVKSSQDGVINSFLTVAEVVRS